jgi:hypothetical protein
VEEGYQGGYDQVRRYIGKRRRLKQETFIPLDHDPGQRVEADFGHIGVDFPEGRRQVPVLLLTWAYSYCVFAIALSTERTEAILHGMVEGFEFFGCVPKEVWWDNPTTVAVQMRAGSGSSTGSMKTHLAIALGPAACRQGRRVRFLTAAALVNRLEEAQKQYQLERFFTQLDKTELLICVELGYLSFSRTGAELLFHVFADRYERASTLITSNLAFSDGSQVFPGERMTAALLDRLTHRCHIFVSVPRNTSWTLW